MAAQALGNFGDAARPAVPALIEARRVSDSNVCAEVITALRRIAPEVLTNGVAK